MFTEGGKCYPGDNPGESWGVEDWTRRLKDDVWFLYIVYQACKW